MPAYRVTWEIDIDVDTPRKAAEEALKIQRDPNSLSVVFTVWDDQDSDPWTVDLAEETDPYEGEED
jgi:hypothetical protein